MALAQTIGIDMPEDFPTPAYNAVNVKLAGRQLNPFLWTECASGWNAVASRFKTAADANELFVASIRENTTSHREFQVQEEALFNFFVAGYAAIESFAYALFALGAMRYPSAFPMTNENDLRNITPSSTQRKFAAHFGTAPVVKRFSALVVDGSFKEWGLIRNVLAQSRAIASALQHRRRQGCTVWTDYVATHGPPGLLGGARPSDHERQAGMACDSFKRMCRGHGSLRE